MEEPKRVVSSSYEKAFGVNLKESARRKRLEERRHFIKEVLISLGIVLLVALNVVAMGMIIQTEGEFIPGWVVLMPSSLAVATWAVYHLRNR